MARLRFRKTRRTPMGSISFTLEQLTVDRAGRAHELQAIDGVIAGSTERWSVEASEGGALVRLDAPTRWQGAARMVGPLLDRMAERQVRGEVRRLRSILER